MPKTDPVTGCTVMTMPEFWASEAEHEGKGRSGGEVMGDFYAELDAETERERQSYFADGFKRALEELQQLVRNANEAIAEEGEPLLPMPVCVREIRSLALSQGLRGSALRIEARCERPDGTEGVLVGWVAESSGSRMEPPDYDEGVEWEAEEHAS